MLTGIYRRLLRKVVDRLNAGSADFVTTKMRPKSAAAVGLMGTPRVADDFAVVMQGPVYDDFDFTLETLKLYRRTMPSVRLVVSSWKDTEDLFVERARSIGADVVLSEKPEYSGILNVNMQLVSAHAGVQLARDAGATWILKTRTDQRFYAPNLDSFLVSMANAFPPATKSRQKFRIFGLGMGTLKFGLYHLTDQSLFGHHEDMYTYWSAPMRLDKPKADWPTDPGRRFSEVPVQELFVEAAPETYLATQFLQAKGRSLDWTLADSWAVFRDCFGVVDSGTSDFFWAKNQVHSQLEDDRRYSQVDNRETLDFREWLLLYSGAVSPDSARAYPDALDGRFYDPVLKIA